MSVDQICQDCELEISGILLIVDLRVMDMSEFDVILGIVMPQKYPSIYIYIYKIFFIICLGYKIN